MKLLWMPIGIFIIARIISQSTLIAFVIASVASIVIIICLIITGFAISALTGKDNSSNVLSWIIGLVGFLLSLAFASECCNIAVKIVKYFM